MWQFSESNFPVSALLLKRPTQSLGGSNSDHIQITPQILLKYFIWSQLIGQVGPSHTAEWLQISTTYFGRVKT